MQRNCIFCLTLIRDSLFFDCKRRSVQTNLTKLPLTKPSFPLVWCLQKGILFCFNTIYAAGFLLLRDEREELSYKTTATRHFDNFPKFFLNSTQNTQLCHMCQYEYDALFDGHCSNLWPATDLCQCIGDSKASIWLAVAISHERVSLRTSMHGEPLPVIASDLANMAAQHLYRFSPLSLTEQWHRNRKRTPVAEPEGKTRNNRDADKDDGYVQNWKHLEVK